MAPSPLTDVELLHALMTYEASLPRGVVALLPVPTHRHGRPVWAIVSTVLAEAADGELVGPIRGVRILGADGYLRDEPYGGPQPQLVHVSAGTHHLRRRLRLEITRAADVFFEDSPARTPWMRVALAEAFPGDLALALREVAPDFVDWLAHSPDDRAEGDTQT